MRKVYLFLILALAFPSLALADSKVVGHMEPLPHELLAQPIKLTNYCKGVTIVEWRPTKDSVSITSPSKEAQKVIEKACNKALSNLQKFANKHNLKIDKNKKFKAKIALMPADIYNDGRLYRNLNDNRYRFKNRTRKDIQYIWGWGSENGYLYVRNDVLKYGKQPNPAFELVFVHELWHVISFQYDIFDNLSNDEDEKYRKDEELAQDFSEFNGYGRRY